MLFNKNIILEILQNDFWEKIESYIDEYIMDLEPYELNKYFGTAVDYGLMNGVGEIEIKAYSVEQKAKVQLVSGLFSASVSVEGYVYFEEESMFVGIEDVELFFDFSFTEQGEKALSLELGII